MSGSLRKVEQRRFLVLPENQLAVTAVKQLGPTIKRRLTQLVTLVGPAGCGKSHLVRELIKSWEQVRQDRKQVIVTASQFAANLAEASSRQSIAQFQTRHRNEVQLFICEDIQMLGPRKEAQQQLLAAINDVIDQQGVVLLSSTQMPGDIVGLSRQIVNRIHGGICVPIDLPEVESRRELIQQFLVDDPFPLAEQEINELAEKSPVSPRELAGILFQLRAEASLTGTQQQSHDTRRFSAISSDRLQKKNVRIGEIAKATASRFEVKVTDLKGPRRSQTVSLARQMAMYLARELAQMKYSDIGKFFNRGNHSTVIHACSKISQARKEDPLVDYELQALLQELGAQPLK